LMDKALEQWITSANGNKKVNSHKRLNKKSNKYFHYAMYLTYLDRHSKNMNPKSDIIMRTIDRFFKNGWNHFSLKGEMVKIGMDEVFINPSNRKIWTRMQTEDDTGWIGYLYNDDFVPKAHRAQVEKAKRLFEHFFLEDPQKQRPFWARCARSFSAWVNHLIISYEYYKRDIGDIGLVFPAIEGYPSVMFEFFNWLNNNKPLFGIRMDHLTSADTWGHFIDYMRHEHNADFWKRKEEH